MMMVMIYMWISSSSSITFWKDDPFSTELPLFLCQRSVENIRMGLFLNTLFSSVDLFIISSRPHCLHHCSFIVSLEIRWYQSPDCSSSMLYWLLWIFCLSIKLLNHFTDIYKIIFQDFVWGCVGSMNWEKLTS